MCVTNHRVKYTNYLNATISMLAPPPLSDSRKQRTVIENMKLRHTVFNKNLQPRRCRYYRALGIQFCILRDTRDQTL